MSTKTTHPTHPAHAAKHEVVKKYHPAHPEFTTDLANLQSQITDLEQTSSVFTPEDQALITGFHNLVKEMQRKNTSAPAPAVD